MATNRQITLAARPRGVPRESDFKLAEAEAPEPGDGQFVVRTRYLSVDPYMRGLIGAGSSYAGRVRLGDVMPGRTVGVVAASRHAEFKEGDLVSIEAGWQECAVTDGQGVGRVDTSIAPLPAWLYVLGMPGMTAYFGLLEIGQPRAGESVFVTGAAGAVGSLVGQIAKLKGCRVAGSAGSKRKVDYLLDELGFDVAFDYKDSADFRRTLGEACPGGIDVFFDNVGGPLSDAAFSRINVGARIVVCGQIDQYNATESPQGPRLLWNLIVKQARAEGFLVFQFADRYAEGRRQIAQWLKEGKVKYRETLVDGLENAPKAFIGLFHGENIGKMLVRVAGE